MRNSPAILALILLTIGLFSLQAQVPATPAGALIDGQIGSGEYPGLQKLGDFSFGSSLGPGGTLLNLVVQAPTSGWVALGLGSGIMDGAWMLLAYVAGGKQETSEQLGAAHFHQPVKVSKILAKAVKEEAGMTTLELQVRAADFAKDGKLPVIMAYGRSDDFISKHLRYQRTQLQLK